MKLNSLLHSFGFSGTFIAKLNRTFLRPEKIVPMDHALKICLSVEEYQCILSDGKFIVNQKYQQAWSVWGPLLKIAMDTVLGCCPVFLLKKGGCYLGFWPWGEDGYLIYCAFGWQSMLSKPFLCSPAGYAHVLLKCFKSQLIGFIPFFGS